MSSFFGSLVSAMHLILGEHRKISRLVHHAVVIQSVTYHRCSVWRHLQKHGRKHKSAYGQRNWTKLKWHGLVIDELTNVQVELGHFSLVDPYV